MDKSAEAFRTISEVATLLETPAHVLRFWETRFPQVRPVKRAGGRRYYRPNDVALLTGIKYLLHAEGMTIRGVQKVLRDQGVRHVAALIGAEISDIDQDAEAALSAALSSNFGIEPEPDMPPERAETATIVALETALRRSDRRPAPEMTLVAPPLGAVIDTVDFTKPLEDAPTFPGFDLGPPQRHPPLTRTTAAKILCSLPRGAFAKNTGAAPLLARARALQARMAQDAESRAE
jgi:DNA-binding transcriptional MerR regulator